MDNESESRLVNPTLISLKEKGKGKLEEKKAVALLLNQITCIVAPEGDSFHTYYDRFVELLNACFNHGHDALLLKDFFYIIMTPSMKRLIHTLSRGDFLDKNPEEEIEFLVEIIELT